MRRLIIIINLSLIVAFMMMFADCSDSSKDRKQVSIGYVNWSEGIAMSYLAKVMLESKGYATKIIPVMARCKKLLFTVVSLK